MQKFETKLELPWGNIQKWKNQLENRQYEMTEVVQKK